MTERRLTSIILAAGEGTRMRSMLPKVLHRVAGRAMVAHAVAAAASAGSAHIALVVGPGRDDVAKVGADVAGSAAFSTHVQTERRGTAHAVLAARDIVANAKGDIVIAFGDTPLLRSETFAALCAPLATGASVVVAAFEAHDPTGYGRVIMENGAPVAIREHKDANASERAITLCNGGLMALAADHALALLEAVTPANAQNEFYLTDLVGLARAAALRTAVITIDEEEVMGVNDRVQLAAVEAVMQSRLREKAMRAGATLVAPDTIFLSHDTVLGSDVMVHPHVVVGPGVVIEDRVEILPFSHVEGARIRAGARLGPFARIRPKSDVGENVHVGNFVEINRSVLSAAVEANHLAYIGDATVGEGTNIGAGTITCNFDGADKHRTTIGRDVFVGSNSTLVAPLSIGDEVLIAAGSTVTKDVPDGALAFGRAKQAELAGKGASRIRQNKLKRAERKARGG